MKIQSGYLKEQKNTPSKWMKFLVYLMFTLAVFFNLISHLFRPFLFVFIGFSLVYILIRKSVKAGKYLWFLFAFMLYSILACFWSVASNPFGDIVIPLLAYGVFAFCLYNIVETREDCDRYLRLFCYAGLGFCLYSIVFYGPSTVLSAIQSGERLGGQISDINLFGMYAGISFTLCLYFAKMRKKHHYYLLALLALPLVLASSSRKAILFALCAILYFFCFPKLQKSFFKGVLALGIALGAVFLLLQLPVFEQISQRLQIFFDTTLHGSTTADQSTEVRMHLVEIGMNLFRENPLFGKGTNSFRYIAGGFFNYGSEISAHNTHVDILANFGLVGALTYYFPILSNAWGTFKGAMREIPAFYCMFFMATISLVLLDMSYVSYHFIIPYAFNTLFARAIELYHDDLQKKIEWESETQTVEENSKYLK